VEQGELVVGGLGVHEPVDGGELETHGTSAPPGPVHVVSEKEDDLQNLVERLAALQGPGSLGNRLDIGADFGDLLQKSPLEHHAGEALFKAGDLRYLRI